ncbi:MAG: flagellar basal-body MS-ring/collar protein FliF [bacterium]
MEEERTHQNNPSARIAPEDTGPIIEIHWARLRSRLRFGSTVAKKRLRLFVSAVFLIALIVTVYLDTRPDYAQLVSMTDDQRLNEIVNHLEANNIEYELAAGGQTINVLRSERDLTRMDLAEIGLLCPAPGPGIELFDTTRLGMTDRVFETIYLRALENELARTIRDSEHYDSVFVHILMPSECLFKLDQDIPKASVKIFTGWGIPQKKVVAIQNLVAAAVPYLKVDNVQVVDRKNRSLARTEPPKQEAPRSSLTNKQDKIRKLKEADLKSVVKAVVEKVVRPKDFDIFVQLDLAWTEKMEIEHGIDVERQAPVSETTYEEVSNSACMAGEPGGETLRTEIRENIANYDYPKAKIERSIDVEQQALVSEKTYEEVSRSAVMAGEPGVARNVQDTGIAVSGGESLRTEISENIANYDYPKTEIRQSVHVEQQAAVSEKTYEEVSNSAAMAGEPGVAGNVQRTGIGASGGETLRTEISECISNYDYPAPEPHTKYIVGEVTAKHVSLLLNRRTNPETGKLESVSDEIIDLLRQQITTAAALDLDSPNSKDSLSIESLEFDTREGHRKKRVSLFSPIWNLLVKGDHHG